MQFDDEYLKGIGGNKDQYFLVKQIKKDEIFITYLGVKEKNRKLYIIKEIKNQYIGKEKINNSLKKEIDNIISLRDNNIVYINSTLGTYNNTYIITEYCNGGSLKDFQQYYINKYKTQLNEKFIQNAINQIVSGLEYINDNHIICRDIELENIYMNFDKYSNIIIDGKLPPKLNYSKVNIDDQITFKIGMLNSKIIRNLNIDPKIVGAKKYWPPEMIKQLMEQGDKTNNFDNKSSIWSLGVITYELLTGKNPFIGSNSKDIYNAIMEGKYTLPKNFVISFELIRFMSKLLQYNPEKRLNLSQIKEHPFLKGNIGEFNYLKLEDTIEMDSKATDNLLPILLNRNKKKDDILNEKTIRENKVKKINLEKKNHYLFGEENIKEKKIHNKANENQNEVKEKGEIKNDIKSKELEILELKKQIMKLKLENEKRIKDYEKELNESKKMIINVQLKDNKKEINELKDEEILNNENINKKNSNNQNDIKSLECFFIKRKERKDNKRFDKANNDEKKK